MSKKKTISLPDYVAKVAESKAKIRFGGNFSNYLQWLICGDNTDDVKRILDEEEKLKPVRLSEIHIAEFANKCPHCGGKIKAGDKINE
jgi:hypothetical protein